MDARVRVRSRESRTSNVTASPGSTPATGGMSGCQRLCPPAAPLWTGVERSISIRSVKGAAPAQSPYERPMTSSITSSVPAPMRLRRMSLQARSIPYSFM